MKKHPMILLVGTCFSILLFSDQGQAKPTHPLKHHLIYQLMFVPGGLNYIWRVDTAGKPGPSYKSLHEVGLLFWVSHLPKGTELQYVKPGWPAERNPEEGVPEFSRFCRHRSADFNDRLPTL